MSGDKEVDADREGEGEEEDGALQAMGFMFDDALPKLSRRHTFSKPGGETLEVTVACVDDTPGALQSGHYVWPGAPALAQYLIDKWSSLALPADCRVIELGAGCGLVGLTAAQLPGCASVTFTDHDPGTLKLIKESISLQRARLKAECRVFPLEWGAEDRQGPLAGETFDLVVGSDLIYCSAVVKPLLTTVASFLHPKGHMLLMGSFVLTPDCEESLQESCRQLKLQRDVVARIGDSSLVWIERFHRDDQAPPQS